MNWFGKRLSQVLRKDRLAVTLSLMFQDLDRAMDKWGSSGTFNTFDDIYNVLYSLAFGV